MTREKRTYQIGKKLLLFIFILVGLNLLITTYFYKVSLRNNKLFKQDRAFHQSPDDISFLIMGHSRAAVGIDHKKIPGAANFCSGGESNVYTYYKLKYVLEESDKTIETVILPAGFLSFNRQDPSLNSNSFYWKKYVDFLEIGEISKQQETYRSVWLKSKIVPWYEYFYLKLLLISGDVEMGIDKQAYPSYSDQRKIDIADQVIRRSLDNRFCYDRTSFVYLKKIVNLCQQHQCNLVFVSYPVSSYYIKAKNNTLKNPELKQRYELFSSYLKKQEGFVHWDFQELFADQDSLFADPQHLNKQGQAHFTEHIKSKLIGSN